MCSPAGMLASAAQPVQSAAKADQALEGAAGLDKGVAVHGRVLQGRAPTMRVCRPLTWLHSRACLAGAVGLDSMMCLISLPAQLTGLNILCLSSGLEGSTDSLISAR